MMIDAIRLMWRDINTPSDYRENWLLWAQNQSAHVAIGIVFTGLVSFLLFVMLGELAHKALLWGIVAVGFAGQQGKQWVKRPIDTFEDFVFVVVYGAGLSVLMFNEIEAGSPEIISSITSIAPIFAIILTHLATGSLCRAVRQVENEQ